MGNAKHRSVNTISSNCLLNSLSTNTLNKPLCRVVRRWLRSSYRIAINMSNKTKKQTTMEPTDVSSSPHSSNKKRRICNSRICVNHNMTIPTIIGKIFNIQNQNNNYKNNQKDLALHSNNSLSSLIPIHNRIRNSIFVTPFQWSKSISPRNISNL